MKYLFIAIMCISSFCLGGLLVMFEIGNRPINCPKKVTSMPHDFYKTAKVGQLYRLDKISSKEDLFYFNRFGNIEVALYIDCLQRVDSSLSCK